MRAHILAVSAVLLSSPLWGTGERLQRGEYSVGGGTSAAGGQILESTIGQVVSLKMSGSAHNSYSGYLNTNHSPGTITNLTGVAGPAEGEMQLTWTAPGADGSRVTATSYILRFSTSQISNQTQFESAATRTIFAPGAPGSAQSYTLTGLTPTLTYYVAIEARDAAKNQAVLSNIGDNDAIIFATPPSDITDLSAFTGSSGGELRLTWTSPGDNGTVGALNPGIFRIDYSTDPGHVFSVSSFQVQIATVAAALSAQGRTIGDLIGNATYYAAMFTGDDVPAFSGVSNTTSALTLAHVPGVAGFTDLSTFSVRANWLANNNSAGTNYQAELSTDPAFGSLLSNSGFIVSLNHVFTGLTAGQTYYGRVKARNSALVETGYAFLGTGGSGAITIPFGISPPINISVTSEDRSLRLAWTPVTVGSPASVRIYRGAASGGPFTSVATVDISSTTYTDAGLVNGSNYFYVLTSIGSDGSESANSQEVSGVPRDVIAPFGVAGLKRTFDPTLVLSWNPVQLNANATAIEDLKGYRIYSAADFFSPEVAVAEVIGELSFVVPNATGTVGHYYFVRAFDTSGNEGLDSLWVRNPGLGGFAETSQDQFFFVGVSPDRRWHAQIKGKASPSLYGESNSEGADIVLSWSKHPNEIGGRVVAADSLTAASAKSGRNLDKFEFRRLGVELFFDLQRASALDPVSFAAAPNAPEGSTDYAAFWFNGVEYVKFGGELEFEGRVLRVTARTTGKFQVRRSLRADKFVVIQTAPRKIFTPNGDGVNDSFNIYFENPLDSVISQAKIFDINGAEISDFQLGLSGDSLSWDGREHGGPVARGGLYFYQIQTEGKTFNGTIVLAK